MRHKAIDQLADHRRAPHAAADMDRPADLARPIGGGHQADIVELDRGAVIGRAGDGDLELARQVEKFGMDARPLPDDLGHRARIDDLVGSRAGEGVGGDVADAIARGLDGVHLDRGQFVEDFRHVLELGPVVLDVLARGEMAVAAVVGAGDMGEPAHLRARSAFHRECRRGAYRRAAADRARSSAATAGTGPR